MHRHHINLHDWRFSVDVNSTTGTNNNQKTCQATITLGQPRLRCTVADVSYQNEQFYITRRKRIRSSNVTECRSRNKRRTSWTLLTKHCRAFLSTRVQQPKTWSTWKCSDSVGCHSKIPTRWSFLRTTQAGASLRFGPWKKNKRRSTNSSKLTRTKLRRSIKRNKLKSHQKWHP